MAFIPETVLTAEALNAASSEKAEAAATSAALASKADAAAVAASLAEKADAAPTQSAIDDLNALVAEKQNQLISGDDIKTLNGESLLGAGNIQIRAKPYYFGSM